MKKILLVVLLVLLAGISFANGFDSNGGFNATFTLNSGWNLVAVPRMDNNEFAVNCPDIAYFFYYSPLLKTYAGVGNYNNCANDRQSCTYYSNKNTFDELQLEFDATNPSPSYYAISTYGAAWVYSSSACSIPSYYLPDKVKLGSDYELLSEYPLRKGWNFVGVAPWMVGKSFSSIFANCLVNGVNSWNSVDQSWAYESSSASAGQLSQDDSIINETAVGKAFMVKLAQDCQLSTVQRQSDNNSNAGTTDNNNQIGTPDNNSGQNEPTNPATVTTGPGSIEEKFQTFACGTIPQVGVRLPGEMATVGVRFPAELDSQFTSIGASVTYDTRTYFQTFNNEKYALCFTSGLYSGDQKVCNVMFTANLNGNTETGAIKMTFQGDILPFCQGCPPGTHFPTARGDYPVNPNANPCIANTEGYSQQNKVSLAPNNSASGINLANVTYDTGDSGVVTHDSSTADYDTPILGDAGGGTVCMYRDYEKPVALFNRTSCSVQFDHPQSCPQKEGSVLCGQCPYDSDQVEHRGDCFYCPSGDRCNWGAAGICGGAACIGGGGSSGGSYYVSCSGCQSGQSSVSYNGSIYETCNSYYNSCVANHCANIRDNCR